MNKQNLIQLTCLVAVILVAGCGSATEKAATEPAPREVTPASAPSAAASESTVPSTESMRFVLGDSDRQQSLQLGERTDGGFDVTLAVTGACSRTETGTAKEEGGTGDPDIMIGADGDGYPVEAFELTAQGGCKVQIRLDSLERGYVWLKEWDCNSSCPLSEDAMTRK